MFTIAALYQFAPVTDVDGLRTLLLSVCRRHGVEGTLLSSAERTQRLGPHGYVTFVEATPVLGESTAEAVELGEAWLAAPPAAGGDGQLSD